MQLFCYFKAIADPTSQKRRKSTEYNRIQTFYLQNHLARLGTLFVATSRPQGLEEQTHSLQTSGGN